MDFVGTSRSRTLTPTAIAILAMRLYNMGKKRGKYEEENRWMVGLEWLSKIHKA